jgi:hypothetical protein
MKDFMQDISPIFNNMGEIMRGISSLRTDINSGKNQNNISISPISVDGLQDVIEILPGVFLGDRHLAGSKSRLFRLNITAILNCSRRNYECNSRIDYLHLPMMDSDSFYIISHLTRGTEFIARRIEEDKNILIHCRGNYKRCGVLIIGYLVKYRGYNLIDAYNFVKSTIDGFHLNPGFFVCLCDFERECGNSRTFTNIYTALEYYIIDKYYGHTRYTREQLIDLLRECEYSVKETEELINIGWNVWIDTPRIIIDDF